MTAPPSARCLNIHCFQLCFKFFILQFLNLLAEASPRGYAYTELQFLYAISCHLSKVLNEDSVAESLDFFGQNNATISYKIFLKH